MKLNAGLLWPFQLRQLAVMIEAGMSIGSALQSLDEHPGGDSSKLVRAKNLLARGVSLPDAFLRAKVIGQFDHSMLLAAESAGQLADGLKHVSERRINQLQRVESLKSSLVLPKAILLIGAGAGLFTRTGSGYQSVAEACLSVSILIMWFYLLAYATLFLVRLDTRVWMSWFWPHSIIRKNSRWYCMALEYLFYHSFIWQVAGGIVASDAAKGCRQLLSSAPFQDRVIAASIAMERGTSIGYALIFEGLVLTSRMRQVLLIADQSGTHEAAVKNELKLQQLSLKQQADNFFKWAPRLFYLIVLMLVSRLIIT